MHHYCSISCGIAASVGALSHSLYFVRGEHHQHTLQFLQILFYGFLSSSFVLARLLQVQYAQAMQLAAMVIGSYLTALWMSMLIYRAFFHRLNSFAGPRLAKLSKFYQFFTGLRLDAFRRSHEAHQRYGNFVRTGKSVSFRDSTWFAVSSWSSRFPQKLPFHQEIETFLTVGTQSCEVCFTLV